MQFGSDYIHSKFEERVFLLFTEKHLNFKLIGIWMEFG